MLDTKTDKPQTHLHRHYGVYLELARPFPCIC